MRSAIVEENIAGAMGNPQRVVMIEKLNQPFLLVGPQGDIRYANRGACNKFKYAPGGLQSINISALDPALSEEMWPQIWDTVIAEGELNYESHVTTATGEIVPYEFRLQRYAEADSTLVCIFAIDISSRKEVESDIIAARESAMAYASQLREKTKIAQDALAKVRLLKEKQDGDYYLTSMLLEPFAQNRASSDRVAIDWFIRQKTRFSYRRWTSEIGGDFCCAETVILRGRKFTFFTIADAMGKANQGASGALILATIVSTYVRRTNKAPHLSELFPERWLRLLHEELCNGFKGFDGQMMIAVASGLIDEEGLCLYFFNAEQPKPVLYSEGIVEYLGSDSVLPKIGMPGDHDRFTVEVCRLNPGDSVVFGSDGRDDVRLYSSGELNFDDSFFPDLVAQNHGDIQAIYDETRIHGEIIDDYSLLRIRISPSTKPDLSAETSASLRVLRETGDVKPLVKLVAENQSNSVTFAALSNYYLKKGDNGTSVEFLRRYLDLRSDDLRAHFSLVRQCLAMRDMQAAIDAAERITYRCVNSSRDIPTYRKILNLLALIYRHEGNPRASFIEHRLEEVI